MNAGSEDRRSVARTSHGRPVLYASNVPEAEQKGLIGPVTTTKGDVVTAISE